MKALAAEDLRAKMCEKTLNRQWIKKGSGWRKKKLLKTALTSKLVSFSPTHRVS